MTNVVWILGYERSGTTLVRSVLARSPQLAVHLSEPHYILELFQRFGAHVDHLPAAIEFLASHRKFPAAFPRNEGAAEGDAKIRALADLYAGEQRLPLSEFVLRFFRAQHDFGAHRPLVLKHPEFTYHLEMLEALFPETMIVNMLRDPRAAISSSMARWPKASIEWRIRRWIRAVAAAEAWQQRHPDRILTLRYEDLVREPTAALDRLCQFLGIRADPVMLAGTGGEATEVTGSASPQGGVDASPLKTWRTRLTTRQQRYIERRCGSWMATYGYRHENPKIAPLAFGAFVVRDQAHFLSDVLRRQLRHSLGS